MITKLLTIQYRQLSPEALMDKLQTERGFKAQAAFELIYGQFCTDLLTYIYYLVKNREIANELTNDSFLALFHYQHSFNSQLKLKPWLWRIGRNKAFNYLKKKKEIPQSDLHDPSEQDCSPIYNIVDQVDNQLQKILSQEQNIMVQTAMLSLALNQKEALELWMQDFSFDEISEMMDRSPQAVKNLIHRGKQALITNFSNSQEPI